MDGLGVIVMMAFAAPIIFVIVVLMAMVIVCFLTCWTMQAWHWIKGDGQHRTVCEQIKSAWMG